MAKVTSSSSIPEEQANFFNLLPEGCIAIIISFTTPADACRLALVSKNMLSASESNFVWNRFLPSDIDLILSRSNEEEALLTNSQSKKQLYKRLSTYDRIFVDQTSKKCWMIGARSLCISWSEERKNWNWSPFARSRFPEAIELLLAWWFEINTTIQTSMLSPRTLYKAYLVYSMTNNSLGFTQPFQASVSIVGVGSTVTEHVYLDVRPTKQRREERTPARRADGWWEVMIGEFFSNDFGEEGDEVKLSVSAVEGANRKKGIIIDGIELRPGFVA